MTIGAYRLLSRLARPMLRYHLGRRLAAGREDGQRIEERMGRPSRKRPAGVLIWSHAASVGEALSLMSVIDRLRSERPGFALLVTSGTVTSARILAERLPHSVIHQYMPVDSEPWVRSFLDHWQPDLALWTESEFWPSMLSELNARDVPVILVNARISARSWRRWNRVRWFSRPLLQAFDSCLAQSERDARRLRALGARHVSCTGNLKFAAAAPPACPAQLAKLATELGSRPRWLAFSTHPGEEEIVADAHIRLTRSFGELLTILVPRHPDRGSEVAALLEDRKLITSRRSLSEPVIKSTDILLADTIGELGLFFRLAEVSLVGGSLVPRGGQNLLEPAKLGSAILHGPHMENFREIRDVLQTAGATAEVCNAEEIANEVSLLLLKPSLRQARSDAASMVLARQGAVLDVVFCRLDPYFERLAAKKQV